MMSQITQSGRCRERLYRALKELNAASTDYMITIFYLLIHTCYLLNAFYGSSYLEKTGRGQYFTSSPKTWRKFLLKPRLKPFLSGPWRNTGARTASEITDTERGVSLLYRWINMALPAQTLNNLLFKLMTGAHSDNRSDKSPSRCTMASMK